MTPGKEAPGKGKNSAVLADPATELALSQLTSHFYRLESYGLLMLYSSFALAM